METICTSAGETVWPGTTVSLPSGHADKGGRDADGTVAGAFLSDMLAYSIDVTEEANITAAGDTYRAPLQRHVVRRPH